MWLRTRRPLEDWLNSEHGPDELTKELEFMLLIGKPPFRPDDYVDIYVEDQRVFIEFDRC